MDRTASGHEKACILVVSLAEVSPGLRDGIETQMCRQSVRIIDTRIVFHHLERARSDWSIRSAMQDVEAISLGELLASLTNLKLVITFGVAAHLSTISAYGMGWTRVPFRPGKMTALPDGLVLANLPAAQGKHIDTIAALLAQIPPALGAALSV